jgi:hypothetical protein
MDSEYEPWIKSIIPPNVGRIAFKVFNFLRENKDEAEIIVSGMQPFVKGLDKLYLYKLADEQGIVDMRRYDEIIDYYKSKILNEQAKNFNKKES